MGSDLFVVLIVAVVIVVALAIMLSAARSLPVRIRHWFHEWTGEELPKRHFYPSSISVAFLLGDQLQYMDAEEFLAILFLPPRHQPIVCLIELMGWEGQKIRRYLLGWREPRHEASPRRRWYLDEINFAKSRYRLTDAFERHIHVEAPTAAGMDCLRSHLLETASHHLSASEYHLRKLLPHVHAELWRHKNACQSPELEGLRLDTEDVMRAEGLPFSVSV